MKADFAPIIQRLNSSTAEEAPESASKLIFHLIPKLLGAFTDLVRHSGSLLRTGASMLIFQKNNKKLLRQLFLIRCSGKVYFTESVDSLIFEVLWKENSEELQKIGAILVKLMLYAICILKYIMRQLFIILLCSFILLKIR